MTSDDVVDISGVSVQFGGLKAVSDVTFRIAAGEVLGLVGPNGAGKSTLFNAVTGLVPVSEGRIVLFGEDMTEKPAHKRMRLGIARTFQLGGLVPGLTVLENVVLGLDHKHRVERRGMRVTRRREVQAQARETLGKLGLSDVEDVEAKSLGSGTQRAIEVARCVAAGARVVLLDEPGVGLTPDERNRLKRLVRDLADSGTSVFVTDHDADIVFGVSDRVLVLNHGQALALGPAEEVRRNPEVARAYLGAERAEEIK